MDAAHASAQEFTISLRDGARLFYRAWIPATPARRSLILVHRGHEHSGRWQETVDCLALRDFAVFAYDARGHGRSDGERGGAPDFAAVVKDLDEFVQHLRREHHVELENTVVLAHSVGAVTAAAWVHDYGPPIRGLILATPALRVRLYVPFAIPLLRWKQRLFGPGHVKSYVKATMITHDAEQAQRYDADELIFRQIAVNILIDLHDAGTRLIADAGAITVPTLLLAAGSDWVVSNSASRRFYERLSSRMKRMEFLPGLYHAVFHERDRHVAIAKVREFIDECFARPAARESLLDADRYGHTRDEYDRLRGPGNVVFKATRWFLRTIGRLSRGVALGWKSGFDSGVTLDYVYENRPQGSTPLGKFIDWSYLNSVGWHGIRQRRANLEQMLTAAIVETHAAGKPARILDIACGAGRYVLETMHKLRQVAPHPALSPQSRGEGVRDATPPISAVLRDYKPENLDAARRRAGELGVTNVEFVQGDAFDRGSLANLTPRPTIAIVSGLYELFPENEPVLRSLRGLADAMEPGGYLLYTNQPWHPQVEFIARVLTNREGQPWIMRRRTQAEMDQLVREAGFEKVSQEIDAWGIFTVSLARRAGA